MAKLLQFPPVPAFKDVTLFSLYLHDQRETICQVIAGPTVEPHLGAVLPGDHPKSVMLDFVQPLAA
jgi:hypothetical protein